MVKPVWNVISLFLALGAFLGVGINEVVGGEDLVWAVGKAVAAFFGSCQPSGRRTVARRETERGGIARSERGDRAPVTVTSGGKVAPPLERLVEHGSARKAVAGV